MDWARAADWTGRASLPTSCLSAVWQMIAWGEGSLAVREGNTPARAIVGTAGGCGVVALARLAIGRDASREHRWVR